MLQHANFSQNFAGKLGSGLVHLYIASRSHAYIEDIFARTINRRSSARLAYTSSRLHMSAILFEFSTFRPDYSRIILNSPHPYYSQNHSGLIGASPYFPLKSRRRIARDHVTS